MSKIDNEIKEGTPRFKKDDAFEEIAPHPLVFMEVNEVKVSQSYSNENGGKVGGDVPSLSPALSQVLSQDEEKGASIDAKDATSSSKVATLDEKAASLADNRRNSAIRKQRQELYKEPHC